MEKKYILLAIVIAIIVVAACAVVILKDDKNPQINDVEDVRLLVYGNANNDDNIDNKDVEVLEKILKDIGNGVPWDSNVSPYADTNYDGKITQDDIILLKKIINKESCELFYKEYYMTTHSNVVSVKYPMKTDSIGVYQYQPGILLKILGLWDNVDYADDTTRRTTDMLDITDKIKSYGAYSSSILRNTDGLEMFDESNVDVLVLNGYYDDTVVKDGLAVLDKDIQVIKPYCQGGYCVGTALTFGFILGQYEQAMEYVNYYDKAKNFIDTALKDLPESEYKSYIVPQSGNDPGKITISSVGLNGTYPELDWIIKTIPGVNKMPWGDNDKYTAYREAEWFTHSENSTDFIIISVMKAQWTAADSDMEKTVNQCSEMFKESNAYNNGNIIGVKYSSFAGFYSPSMFALVAAYMYPDYIDLDKAWEMFDRFFEKYPVYGVTSHEYSGVYKMHLDN